jgi:hypothetical protein
MQNTLLGPQWGKDFSTTCDEQLIVADLKIKDFKLNVKKCKSCKQSKICVLQEEPGKDHC